MKSLLFNAAEMGNISMFRAALAGSTIDDVNERGETPLMVACKFGHVQLVKFILSRNADVSLTDSDGRTARDLAASSAPEIVHLFGSSSRSDGHAESNMVKNCLLALAENVDELFKESETFFERIDERTKVLIRDDLAKVIFFIRNQEALSLLDGFGFALSYIRLSAKAQFDEVLPLLKICPPEKLEDFARNLFGVAKLNKPTHEVTEKNFSVESLDSVNQEDADKLRKFFYEFSELIIKADGVVTEQEAKALKYLARQLFAAKAGDALVNSPSKVAGVSLDSILSDLNCLVGMEDIKNEIRSLINIINVNQLRKKEGLPEQKLSMHSVFIGPPGTGKTTIARMLSEIYHSLAVLNGNNFVEIDRGGLVAGYVGQTAIKTDEVIGKALNGVLFVDEAYTLARGSSDSDFGQEAIDILLKRMEDNRDKLIVIVAGYQDEMMTFINSNPGLKSRFNRFFYFSDYTPLQLKEIYRRIIEAAGFTLSDDASEKLDELFEVLYSRRDKRFGNARLVRNIFEKTFERHANRTASVAPITRAILTTLLVEDIPFLEFINAV